MKMAFTGSGKKEDMSMRLRAQNIKNAREQTQKLETESRKMEERLKELKMAMTREKAEREQKGGGFWRSGKSGSLGNDYTKDVLSKPLKSAEKKKARVKVLKDEPVATPERNKGPGTMGYIAQRDISNKENKTKGPKCGQCEQKAAQVTCLECGEDYCAGCFASFHIKGALKKHRSVPVRAGDARIFSPRPPLSVSSKSDTSVTNGHYSPANISTEDNPMKLTLTEIDFTLSPQMIQNKGYGHELEARRTPVGSSQTLEGPSLLDGQYSEADSAASFQQALQAWRQPAGQQSQPKVASVEHGTSTNDSPQEKREIKIEFKSGGSLTYAEKLLLKKHRRTSLEPMETPRLGSERGKSTTPTMLTNPASTSVDANLSKNGQSTDLASEGNDLYLRPGSEMSIIEMTDDRKLPDDGVDQGKTYLVRESPNETEVLHTAREEKYNSAVSAKKARKQANITPPPTHPAKNRSARHRKVKSPISPVEIIRDGSELTGPDLSKPIKAKMIEVMPKCEERLSSGTSNAQQSSASRPRSRNQRPSSGRPASRAASRPVSRTASRLAIFGEGHLTKVPSSALHTIAHMQVDLPAGDPLRGLALTDFFTGGAQPQQHDRVLTPRAQSAKPKEDKWKISNKLYQMGPRSWRPDSSLGDAVPMDTIVIDPVTLPQAVLEMDAMDANEISLLNPAVHTHTTDLMERERSWQPEQALVTPRHSRPSHLVSGRLSQAGRESRSGRQSEAIVVEGDDMSRYDDAPDTVQVNEEDEETLNQLDWELASEAGMITDDGKISRLSMIDLGEHEAEQDDIDLNTLRELMTPRDKGIDIRHHLRESELMEDFEEMEAQIMEDEVKALR